MFRYIFLLCFQALTPQTRCWVSVQGRRQGSRASASPPRRRQTTSDTASVLHLTVLLHCICVILHLICIASASIAEQTTSDTSSALHLTVYMHCICATSASKLHSICQLLHCRIVLYCPHVLQCPHVADKYPSDTSSVFHLPFF
jgi:hypothetical protein